MALIACPECRREGVSDQAPTCPGCGYPIAPAPVPAAAVAPPKADVRTCRDCSRPATTRCVGCGALSCAEHVSPVTNRDFGGQELRCARCAAAGWPLYYFSLCVLGVVLLIVLGVVIKLSTFKSVEQIEADAKRTNAREQPAPPQSNEKRGAGAPGGPKGGRGPTSE